MQSSNVATTTFKIVKKGYDPDEVRAYLKEVASALQAAQEHAGSVETRARQAIARAKEEAAQQIQAAAVPLRTAKLDDTETISRTLLLAQKTADDTIAQAEQEAAEMRDAARTETETLLDEARNEVARASEAARAEARRAGESERQRVESELQQLLARLEFLRDDVAQMEAHTAHQRERLLQVADELQTLASRPTAGLGESRRPVLSAAADLDGREVTATQAIPTMKSSSMMDPSADVAPETRTDEGAEDASDSKAASADAERTPDQVSAADQLFGESGPPDHLDITAEVPIVE